MGQFIRVNGDYNIKTIESGIITLDTGPGVGEVRVTGNLVVEGDTLTVSAENLNVNDNIITLNFGETGAGVTLTYSGIQIDRGSLTPTNFLYNETNDAWQIVNGAAGSYSFANSNIKLRRILTDGDEDGGDLTLIGTGTGVVKVAGTLNYELQVTDPDDIPNKAYVDNAIQNQPTFQIALDTISIANPTGTPSRVIVTDKNIAAGDPGSPEWFYTNTGYKTGGDSVNAGGDSAVSVIIDDQLTTQFYPTRTELFDLEIYGTEITTKDGITNENINIRTQGTGKLSTNYALQLDQIPLNPIYVPSSTVLYAKDPEIGTTGIWFVNDKVNPVNVNNPSSPANNDQRYQVGELISKNKALVFSMIF